MRACRALRIGLALLVLLPASAAFGQVEPRSPVHRTVNGVFVLCPQLVRTGAAPDAARLASLGFRPSDPRAPGELWFSGEGDHGVLAVGFDPSNRRCTLHYAGGGYEQISGMVRDTVVQNGFTRLTGGDQDGARADVFEGATPRGVGRTRIIIIENRSQPSAAISYAERAEP
jgi:hypothetical protein